ncbi:TetR/AcrR family transcriptional regulator [Sulfitobacter sp. HGT1]|jgi:AcrR family transcriptional regulator|uniref:TetR/AcrR family transcriptional regulator n=2 Tax=Sulfitobacter TaxID=60136 RepID=UPI0020CC4B6B|nr:TetR/AcrR family transcriptional regulator [Sulfitobacter sp. HGT1]
MGPDLFHTRPMSPKPTPTLSRRERNLADIRARATLIAEQIILAEGVEGLSARRLAQELKVSVGSLYNAFGDLHQVIRSVIARSAEMLASSLMAAVDTAAPDKRSRVVALGEAYFDFAMAEPRRWSLMFEYRAELEIDDKARDFQGGLLDMLIAAGEADPKLDIHRQFFLVLWASVHGVVSLATRPTIIAIRPELAKKYITDLVDSALTRFPAD